MARRRKGRAISGVILVDKPQGMTSNGVLQKVRWLFQAQKAGHTGALDPMATGLLPVCLGEATKFSQYLLDADKAYEATAKLGEETDTLDADGEIVNRRSVPDLTPGDIESVAAQFRGPIQQVPPMYSALKRDGKKLYELARAGETVEREARPVTIHSNELVELAANKLSMSVRCSKGTYIRTLLADMGEQLGCGAHLTALRRTAHGVFDLQNAIPLEKLIAEQEAHGAEALDRHLLPVDALIESLPIVRLDAEQTLRMGYGNPVSTDVPEGQYRVYGAQQQFMGVAQVQTPGKLQPVRLVVPELMGSIPETDN